MYCEVPAVWAFLPGGEGGFKQDIDNVFLKNIEYFYLFIHVVPVLEHSCC